MLRRRPRIVLAACLAALLALPAAAIGAREVLRGGLDDQPAASVKVRTADGARGHRVTAFSARSFEVRCEGGSVGVMRRASLRGEIPIGERRRFRIRDDNGTTVFKLRGRVGRRKAEGRFRFSGEMDVAGGTNRECDSGRLEWSAR